MFARRLGPSLVAFLVSVCGFAGMATAQPGVRPRGITTGMTVGGASAGDSWSGGGRSPALSLHIDVPAAPEWDVRLAGGALRWTPTNVPQDDVSYAGRVSVAVAQVVALRRFAEPDPQVPVGLYAGAGFGRYFYRAEHGSFETPRTWGVHGVAGLEVRGRGLRRAVRAEIALQMMRGPGHPQVWAYTLSTLSASVGVARTF
jgi:hypothetical protein